jgi:hypothetical protein
MTFDHATCHNLRPFKMNNHNGWWILVSQKNSSKKFHNATCYILMNGWKMTTTWHYGCSYKGVA